MNEMIKAERNKICSRKQTRMLFLAGVVLIVAYSFFFEFNYQNVFYDYDLEKMALASGFTAIEQRKEVAEIFENEFYYSDCVVGNISELYDSEEPYKAKGSPAQAWSIAEVFRIIFQGKDKIN